MRFRFSASPAGRRLAALSVLAALAVLAPACQKRVNDENVFLLVTVRVSLGTSNQQGNGDVVLEPPAISADGRYVAFSSKAPNLVANDNNSAADVFFRDMVTRTTVLVSINSSGTGTANGASAGPAISSDGRYVAFHSAATDLIAAGDADALSDVYVRDMLNGTTILASKAPGPLGAKGNGHSVNPDISADGRYVVFQSQATNLDGIDPFGDDNDTNADIYWRDTQAEDTKLISRASLVSGGLKGTGVSARPRVSGDGMLVVFESTSGDIALTGAEGGPDGNGVSDIFLRDVATDFTQRLSLSSAGGDPDQPSTNGSISRDGRFAAFKSFASNLHPDDDGTESDVFILEISTGILEVGSVHSSGAQAGSSCDFPRLSADGSLMTFQSGASTLINGDSNSHTDCFIHDRISKATYRVSVATYGTELNGDSLRPAISADGNYVVFYSVATNLADDDTNGSADVFLRGPPR
jgi:Tol biopolymer transport system component